MFKPSVRGISAFKIAALFIWLLPIAVRSADTDVVINEVMYHAPLDLDELQYVELFNRGTAEVDLSHWSFAKGIKFTFPDKTRLAAGGYLVVCRKKEMVLANYGRNLSVMGDFSGKLSHGGEKIELCNSAGTVIDALKYKDQEPWPIGPDGYSASLERICPFSSGEDPANWAGSSLPAFEKPAGTPGRKNDNFSPHRPPAIAKGTCASPEPMKPTTITAQVADMGGVKEVTLLWRIAQSGGETTEATVPMRRPTRRPFRANRPASWCAGASKPPTASAPPVLLRAQTSLGPRIPTPPTPTPTPRSFRLPTS
jgi:hypothetical protein